MQPFDCNAAAEPQQRLELEHSDELQGGAAVGDGLGVDGAMRVRPVGTDAGVRRRAERAASLSRSRKTS